MTINITRAEGPIGMKDWSYTCSSFRDMDGVLCGWGRSAPERGGGYDKCDVLVEFDEGESYSMRYDLTQGGGENYGPPDFRKTLLTRLKFTAGRHCPRHYSQEQYDGFISSIAGMAEEAREFLDRVQATIEQAP